MIGSIARRLGADSCLREAGENRVREFWEVQVSILTEFIETVLNTARAAQSYAFGASAAIVQINKLAEQRSRRDHGDEWADIQPLLGPALTAVQRCSVEIADLAGHHRCL